MQLHGCDGVGLFGEGCSAFAIKWCMRFVFRLRYEVVASGYSAVAREAGAWPFACVGLMWLMRRVFFEPRCTTFPTSLSSFRQDESEPSIYSDRLVVLLCAFVCIVLCVFALLALVLRCLLLHDVCALHVFVALFWFSSMLRV